MKKLINNNKGFTLVELVVVIVILGILAAVAIPVVGNVIGNANTKADNANKTMYQAAVERYAAENGGVYPANKAAVVSAITTNTGLSSVTDANVSGYEFYYTYSDNKIVYADSEPSGDEGDDWDQISP